MRRTPADRRCQPRDTAPGSRTPSREPERETANEHDHRLERERHRRERQRNADLRGGCRQRRDEQHRRDLNAAWSVLSSHRAPTRTRSSVSEVVAVMTGNCNSADEQPGQSTGTGRSSRVDHLASTRSRGRRIRLDHGALDALIGVGARAAAARLLVDDADAAGRLQRVRQVAQDSRRGSRPPDRHRPSGSRRGSWRAGWDRCRAPAPVVTFSRPSRWTRRLIASSICRCTSCA